MLIATMIALFMVFVVAYNFFNYGYTNIFYLSALAVMSFLAGCGVSWCVLCFDESIEEATETRQPMAKRLINE
jgi:hypothetical protein